MSLRVFGFLVSGGLSNGSSGVGFGWFCSFRFNSVGGTRYNFACVVFVGLVMVALLLVCLLVCLICFGLLLGVAASWLVCRWGCLLCAVWVLWFWLLVISLDGTLVLLCFAVWCVVVDLG